MHLLTMLLVAGSLLTNSHDITSLKAWGPYSKTYSGITHVADVASGNSVDFTLIPGTYRRSYLIPNALYESGCYPWRVSPDMREICYRYELEWKDRVYIDATYHILDDQIVLLGMHCVNATAQPQNILLQTLASVHFADENAHPSEDFFPVWESGGRDFQVKYPLVGDWYGVATNFPYACVKRYENGLLDFFMKRTVHRHPPECFPGDGRGHYTGEFQRPVVLPAESDTTIWNLIVCGPKEFVATQLETFHRDEGAFTQRIVPHVTEDAMTPQGAPYAFGEQILEATLLTNIVYPIVAEGQYIRHFTPGKNWNSLYTWDSGFISWALSCLDADKAFETIRAYTTAPGSDVPFIHHGTPLPTQFFAFADWLSRTSDREKAAFLYPRLKQYYDYFAGHDPRSPCMMTSGLVRTWDLWYNSGGWDDYPAQQWLVKHPELYPSVAPTVSTAFYIRAAKILRLTAALLGYKADIKQYDADIRRMSEALQAHAWDPAAGYFSYVTHDDSGVPTGILRAPDGSNFDRGLDGTSPLAAGICTPEQQEALLEKIFSPGLLWTPYGISTVDQSASYYSLDGYWNGCVWMPHQFILWKSMLDLGLPERARQIAFTALENWSRETALTYESFEHFIIASGRGAGWHNFSGLSSPMVNWFHAYFHPGTVSTGFDVLCSGAVFGPSNQSFATELLFDKDAIGRTATVLLCLAPGTDGTERIDGKPASNYTVRIDGKPVAYESPLPGLLEIPVRAPRSGKCRLEVN